MARSRLPLVRVILVPYLLLFVLFAVITGAGSTWLYFKAREAQSQLLVHGLLSTVSPLVDQLSHSDIGALITDEASWLHRELDTVFDRIPDLKLVRIQSTREGFSKQHIDADTLLTEKIPGRSSGGINGQDLRTSTAAQRLYTESEPLLRIEFRFDDQENGPVSLEFGFSRATLQDAVGRAMSIMINAITLFSVTGLCALVIAFLVTLWASGRVRRLETQVQELYRYATAAELMAGLVHDLRNPLASFRANIASLKIMPEDSGEILQEMDQDLVRLDEKLGSMLDLTRKRDEPLARVDIQTMFDTVSRQAEPILAAHNLDIRTRCRVEHPVDLMEGSLCDALLNLVLNSTESGQNSGTVELSAREENGNIIFKIADRGNGLPEDTDIFEPFVTTKPSGHGLGLAITRRTVEAHGGTIEARNREGGGAVFILRIPQPPRVGRLI